MAAAAAMLLSGCSPEVGLPAVHDMPPPRAEAPLSPDQVKQATDELANERDHMSTAAQRQRSSRPQQARRPWRRHGKSLVDRAVRQPRQLRRAAGRPLVPTRSRDKAEEIAEPPMEDFYRIRRLPPYVFEQVNRAKAAARNGGADIIDLGMGNPDLPAPAHVIEKLKETIGKPRTDRYSASKGIPGLRRAQAAYYERRFGVKLNPETQIVATLGSKEGFANVAQAITAPGDVIVVPNPTYPIHVFGFLMAGGAIRSVPVEPDAGFFGALERAVKHSIPKPIAVVVCYPSNPTAYVADLDFYRDLVAFAKKHALLVLSDIAYAEVYFDGKPPPSVLQVPAPSTLPSNSARCRRPIRCRAGGSALPSATSASSRLWRG